MPGIEGEKPFSGRHFIFALPVDVELRDDSFGDKEFMPLNYFGDAIQTAIGSHPYIDNGGDLAQTTLEQKFGLNRIQVCRKILLVGKGRHTKWVTSEEYVRSTGATEGTYIMVVVPHS